MSRTKVTSADVFADAVDAAEHLELKAGLQAIKRGEGKSQIHKGGGTTLLGSVDMDGDCLQAYLQANRWDYLVGIERQGKPQAIYVEVHSAHTSSVSEMEKKLDWLQRTYLARDAQEKLNRLPAEFHWVASGSVAIPATTPQARYLKTTLRKRKLVGPVARLELK